MRERQGARQAVLPLFLREGKILLQLRQNTGFRDGFWDFAGSGHIEQGERAKTAACREIKEELGLTVTEKDLTFLHLSQLVFADRTYIYFYFMVERFEGTPAIMEPEKCRDLAWFALENLPTQLIPERREALEKIKSKEYYSEYEEKI